MFRTSQTLSTKQPFFYGHFVVAAAFLIMVAIWALYYSFGVFFKPILTEFGWSRAMTSGAFSLSSVISGLMAILMGKLTDKVGPRTVMTLCALQLGLGFFLMSKIDTFWQIYLVLGIIVGTGMGESFVPLMSTVARWFVEKRSMMTGYIFDIQKSYTPAFLLCAGIGLTGLILSGLLKTRSAWE